MSVHDLIVSLSVGLVVGLLFYFCVRLRMHIGPLLRERFGNWARQIYWLSTLVVMAIAANIGLELTRQLVDYQPEPTNTLPQEILYISFAVALAFTLIYKRINRNR
jgi:hypothetical protein